MARDAGDDGAGARWRVRLRAFEECLRHWADAVDREEPSEELDAAVKTRMGEVERDANNLDNEDPRAVAEACLGVARISELLVELPVDNLEVDARAWKVVTRILQRQHARLAEVFREAELLDVALHALEDGLATLQMAADGPDGLGPKARSPVRSAKFIKASASRLGMVVRLSKKLFTLRKDASPAGGAHIDDLALRAGRIVITLAAMRETADQCQAFAPPAGALVRQAAETIVHGLAATATPDFPFGVLVLEALCREHNAEIACVLWNKLAAATAAADGDDAAPRSKPECNKSDPKHCDESTSKFAMVRAALSMLADLAARPGSINAYALLRSEDNITRVAEGAVSFLAAALVPAGAESIDNALAPLSSAYLRPRSPQQAEWAAAVLEKAAATAKAQALTTVLDALAAQLGDDMLRQSASAVKLSLFVPFAASTSELQLEAQNRADLHVGDPAAPLSARKSSRALYESLVTRLALRLGPKTFTGALLLNCEPEVATLSFRDLCCAHLLSRLPRARHPAAPRAIAACANLASALLVTLASKSDKDPGALPASQATAHLGLLALVRLQRFFIVTGSQSAQIAALGTKVLENLDTEGDGAHADALAIETCELLCQPEIAHFLTPDQACGVAKALGRIAKSAARTNASSSPLPYTMIVLLTLLSNTACLSPTVVKQASFVRHTRSAWEAVFVACGNEVVTLALALVAFERFIKTLPQECSGQLASFLPSPQRGAFGEHLKRKRKLVEAQESPLSLAWLEESGLVFDWDLETGSPPARRRKRSDKDLCLRLCSSFQDATRALETFVNETTRAPNGPESGSALGGSQVDAAYGSFQSVLSALRQDWTQLRAAESQIMDPRLRTRARAEVSQALQDFQTSM